MFIKNSWRTMMAMGVLAVSGGIAQAQSGYFGVQPNGYQGFNGGFGGYGGVVEQGGGFYNGTPLFVGPNGVQPGFDSYWNPYWNVAPNETYYGNGDQVPYNDPSRTANNGRLLPRTSDMIQARRSRTSISINWQGEPSAVNRIRFALLDAAGRTIREQIVTGPPAGVRFARNSRAQAYRVVVEYINGEKNTIISPL